MAVTRVVRNLKQKQRLAAEGIKRITIMVPAELEHFFWGTAREMRTGSPLIPVFYETVRKHLADVKVRLAGEGRTILPELDAVIWHGAEVIAARRLFGEDFQEKVEAEAVRILRKLAEHEAALAAKRSAENP